ncbi:response regulator transcription factor [Ideonella oryzae]|uniref:Response regulator n=1 Tax=Ideonella oryzae TaxID=2937441 RepID=A0ABT1BGN0_9BURK|nr:response regulator [Ideonella oryzae]MCO5975238.1 response regulator [Ideonella oryzae]
MKKVLVVEDHADIRRLIRMTLEFEACEVFEANNGASGLAQAQELRPDVILLDVMMPGELDGLEVCRRVKADPTLAHSRVVILSARGTAADVERGQQAGSDAYLVKPFSPLQLIKVIDELSPSGTQP